MIAVPKYQDFSITFRASTGGRYPLSVQSPAGPADGNFELPVPLDGLRSVLESVAIGLRRSAPGTRAIVSKSRDASNVFPATYDLGAKLFTALFAERQVRDRFMRSLGMAERSGAVLRVRLHMNLDNESVRPLATLPWELLYDPDQRKNLVEWPATALVRSLDVPLSNALPPYAPPLRVLFVMANPRRDLDLARERTDIEARLAAGNVPIAAEFLEGATYRSLARRLHDKDYHILHFMGHGGFDERGGVLWLEHENASDGEAIPASELGRLILGEGDVRLIVLNACRTAESAQGSDLDPYTGGVATALVMAGVPAVVAMQFPISDDGAVDFADRLYSSLAGGKTIEAAVREGRRAIRHEWPIPVLFSRCDDELFPMPPSAASVATTALAVAAAPLAAAATSSAFGAPWSADSDFRAELLPYMVDRTDVMFNLDQALRVQDAAPSAPLVAIIHGDDAQCQDKLQQRLWSVELPRLLDVAERDTKIEHYQVVWPQECRGRDDLHARLTSELARRVKPRASTQDLQRYFATLPAPVMLYSTVLSNEWHRYGDSVLDDYLAYWQAWPASVAPQRLLVFLFIKYQQPESGWLRGRKAKKTNEAIHAALDTLARKSVGGIVLKVMPPLRGISQQDVEAWNSDHGSRFAANEIKQLYERQGAGGEELSMQTIGQLLGDLIEERTHTSGGVR